MVAVPAQPGAGPAVRAVPQPGRHRAVPAVGRPRRPHVLAVRAAGAAGPRARRHPGHHRAGDADGDGRSCSPPSSELVIAPPELIAAMTPTHAASGSPTCWEDLRFEGSSRDLLPGRRGRTLVPGDAFYLGFAQSLAGHGAAAVRRRPTPRASASTPATRRWRGRSGTARPGSPARRLRRHHRRAQPVRRDRAADAARARAADAGQTQSAYWLRVRLLRAARRASPRTRRPPAIRRHRGDAHRRHRPRRARPTVAGRGPRPLATAAPARSFRSRFPPSCPGAPARRFGSPTPSGVGGVDRGGGLLRVRTRRPPLRVGLGHRRDPVRSPDPLRRRDGPPARR